MPSSLSIISVGTLSDQFVAGGILGVRPAKVEASMRRRCQARIGTATDYPGYAPLSRIGAQYVARGFLAALIDIT